MYRRTVGLALACAAVAAAAVLSTSAMAASGGGCQLQGTANLSPGLNNSSQNFSYSFSGALSGCQSNVAGAPTSGTVEAGKTVTAQVVNSITGATDTVTYQEPIPTGTGGCASSTTAGTAIANWADGTKTVISYTTTGALAAVSLTGNVVPSVTLGTTLPLRLTAASAPVVV